MTVPQTIRAFETEVTITGATPERGSYTVLASAGDTEYHVELQGPRITCDCPAGAHHFERCVHVPHCKHVEAALWYQTYWSVEQLRSM